MKKSFLFLLCIIFTSFLCTNVYAFSVSFSEGPIEIKANIYAIGTDYSTPGTGNPAWSGTDFVGFDNGGAGTNGTNTYGLITITSIMADLNGDGEANENLWAQKKNEFIVGHFWGLSDDQLSVNAEGTGFIVNEIGGFVNLYTSDTGLDLSQGPSVIPTYDGLTTQPDWATWDAIGDDEDLWLSAEFVPGINSGDPNTTYTEQINALNSPIAGHARAYMDVTGGSAFDALDSGLLTTGIGTKADLLLGIELNGKRTDSGWNKGYDPILGNAVPEPSTLILFGLGLLGFAGLARKKFLK